MTLSDLRQIFLNRTPLLDVRAPVEFQLGSLPGSVNLPIMNNEERALVGTTYKQFGRETAMALGHKLVSGEIKEFRIQQWLEQIRLQPDLILYCFRGGLRSQITQRWLSEKGVHRPLIEGGYKKARHFLIDEIEHFSKQGSLLVLSGPTGSAKTHILNKANSFCRTVDLEALAAHRGSAFGAGDKPQPAQVDFENALAMNLLEYSSAEKNEKVLVEDESRLIGRCAIPESFFMRMRTADVLYVEESFEQRVENIFQDYILKTAIGQGTRLEAQEHFARFRKSTSMISRKLGGVRTQEILQSLEQAEKRYLENPQDLESNKKWIGMLLSYYYDPLYANSLDRRNPKIILKGNAATMIDYLRNNKN